MNEKHSSKYIVIVIFLVCLVGFAILARLAYQHHLSGFDTTIVQDVQRYDFGPLKPILSAISIPGKTVFAGASILLVAGLFWYKKYPREALFVLATGGADALSLAIKHIINRPGPQQIGKVLSSPEATFPSSHVVHYITFFGLLSFLMLGLVKIPSKMRVVISLLGLLLILAIPFSRVLLAEHWLSDVIGGIGLGVMSLIVLKWLYLAPWFLPKLKKQFIVNV